MCQRYVLSDQSATEREFLPDTAWWRFDVRYNVAVGQNVPAIRLHDAGSEGVMLRWGLIPAWSELPPSEPARASVHLARIERSKSFAEPWNSGRRCILPMAGFYLWQLTAAGHRQPYFVHLNNRALFGVAGLWDRWEADDGDVIESCSMISVPSNELVSELAGPVNGMPAILRRKDYTDWLQATPAAAAALLEPYAVDWMQAYPISPRINSLRVDDATLLERIG